MDKPNHLLSPARKQFVNDNKCGTSPFISHTLITDFPVASKNGRILTL